MNEIAYYLLLVLLGYILRGVVGGHWRTNPKHHHAADGRHLWVEIGGKWYAFTDSALAEADARADRLAPLLRNRLVTRLAAVAVSGVLLALSFGLNG